MNDALYWPLAIAAFRVMRIATLFMWGFSMPWWNNKNLSPWIEYREDRSPKGIKNGSGFIITFPRISKYEGQQERYRLEILKSQELAKKILNLIDLDLIAQNSCSLLEVKTIITAKEC